MTKDYMLKRIGKYCQLHGFVWYYFSESKFVYVKFNGYIIYAGSVTSVYRSIFN